MLSFLTIDSKLDKSSWVVILKLFVSPEDGAILGCHAYGAHSADIVQEVSVLMCKHTTIAELADMVHIHPTLSEILKSAVE